MHIKIKLHAPEPFIIIHSEIMGRMTIYGFNLDLSGLKMHFQTLDFLI